MVPPCIHSYRSYDTDSWSGVFGSLVNKYVHNPLDCRCKHAYALFVLALLGFLE
jgi:hypothetical protein